MRKWEWNKNIVGRLLIIKVQTLCLIKNTFSIVINICYQGIHFYKVPNIRCSRSASWFKENKWYMIKYLVTFSIRNCSLKVIYLGLTFWNEQSDDCNNNTNDNHHRDNYCNNDLRVPKFHMQMEFLHFLN